MDAKLRSGGLGEPRNVRSEAKLALMLARQAITRWQFDAARFRDAADNTRARRQDQSMVLMEAELQLNQIEALQARIKPMAGLSDITVSFEAQEMLESLRAVAGQISQAAESLRSTGVPSWRSATDVASAFRARLG